MGTCTRLVQIVGGVEQTPANLQKLAYFQLKLELVGIGCRQVRFVRYRIHDVPWQIGTVEICQCSPFQGHRHSRSDSAGHNFDVVLLRKARFVEIKKGIEVGKNLCHGNRNTPGNGSGSQVSARWTLWIFVWVALVPVSSDQRFDLDARRAQDRFHRFPPQKFILQAGRQIWAVGLEQSAPLFLRRFDFHAIGIGCIPSPGPTPFRHTGGGTNGLRVISRHRGGQCRLSHLHVANQKRA